MAVLVTAIVLTVGHSFLRSLAAGTVLSTTVSDIAALEKKRPRRGACLERLKVVLGETISAILTLHTLVRRRDLLKAKANDRDLVTVENVTQEVHFIPETVAAQNALQVSPKIHRHFLVAVDMRELARSKLRRQAQPSAQRVGASFSRFPSTPRQ